MRANGKKDFDADELRRILKAAPQPLRAMLLLDINCGMGNTDCAELPNSAIDLDGGWIDYPRPKTGVERRCPLWPETARALREALPDRPAAKKTRLCRRALQNRPPCECSVWCTVLFDERPVNLSREQRMSCRAPS